jgi:beta-fructofuranosidase
VLRLEDKWVWDFWTVSDGPTHHIFYLQAPRSLGDPELRHWNASIGHAVSEDLSAWRVLPDALTPGAPDAWDDYTTWTGSIVRTDDGWGMLYTGTCHSENGLVQRVGLATSPDLEAWTKHPANPVMEVDAVRYELLDLSLWHDQAWRDPAVVRDDRGRYHAFITARVPRGPTKTRGVLAHAVSADLVSWEIGDPVVGPGEFGHIEIPQAIRLGDRWHLLYSIADEVVAEPRPAVMGIYQVVSDAVAGPYRSLGNDTIVEHPEWYGAKLVDTTEGLRCLAWRTLHPDGTFAGEIGDPWSAELRADGTIVVDGP